VDTIIFMIFRRMRQPLLVLIVTYAVAILGLTLIPGQDAQGNPWRMDFFHAFYFVSYMSTTIGFGEIPYEFTDGQRMWVTFSIYATVVAWVYSIGTLLTLSQDSLFLHAVTERRFAYRIRRLREPFYLVCGYGETGSELVATLVERNYHVVVVEILQERMNVLRLEPLREYVPALRGDAGRPLHLLEAGLRHPLCAGVAALTNSNDVNLKIAITTKLLHRELTVICRADSHDVEANMRSFGTDYIIDPFDTFGIHLAMAFQAPGLYLLSEWLSGASHQPLTEPVYPPRDGVWIICGYGRFGKAVYQRLSEEGLKTVVVEATPDKTGTPEGGVVVGRGTEAGTLQEAGIAHAVGLIAGTDDDVNNLSAVMTARTLKSDLFVVLRQNQSENQTLIDSVHADIVMHPSRIIANRIRVLLGTPMLYDFLRLAQFEGDEWACILLSRIVALVSDEVPDVWELSIDDEAAHAVWTAIREGSSPILGDIMRDPRDRRQTLECIPLMLARQRRSVVLPEPATALKAGDRLLWCGRYRARRRMEWNLQNEHALSYAMTGEAVASGLIWRWIKARGLRPGSVGRRF